MGKLEKTYKGKLRDKIKHLKLSTRDTEVTQKIKMIMKKA